MIRAFIWFLATVISCSAQAVLQKFENCNLADTSWADGDSFAVRFPDGKERTLRLYGVDCIEMHINNDDTNARRLLDQRRYFGINDILLAKSFGETAKIETARILAKPFTVYTTFADGAGDGRYARIYAFVETSDGTNLSAWLVSQGLARAFGVVRQLHDGTTGKEWKEQLADLELTAARAGRGAWAKTDWEQLPKIRKQARDEIEEIETAKGTQQAQEGNPIDINHAARDQLMTLPSIGEITAIAIIEERPYQSLQDLARVKGIGPALIEKIKDLVTVTPP